MALIHPSLTLVMDLDQRLATQETIDEIRRCYTHIGTPVIRNHAPESEDAPLCNRAQMLVKMGQYKYLWSTDDNADQMWNDVVEKWIGSMLHKVGTNMKQFNLRQRTIGLPEVVFDYFDIELQGGEFVVSLHPNLLGYVGSELQAAVGLSRTLLNDGTFENAVRVRIPADASFEKQREDAYPLWLEEHPEPEVSEEEPKAEEVLTEKERIERTLNNPVDKYYNEAWLAADAAEKSYENTRTEVTDSEELPSAEHWEEEEVPEPFSFEVDYTLWAVQYADGSTKLYDSSTFSFVEA